MSRQPLLAEELMDLTLEELIEDFGADFTLQESWEGFEFELKLGGTVLYSHPLEIDEQLEMEF